MSTQDRTTRAVATQLAAMGGTSFEVGILDAGPGRMLIRTWTLAELEHGMPWLKRENALGHDIYVRPAGSVGLVLLDDLDPATIIRSPGAAYAAAAERIMARFPQPDFSRLDWMVCRDVASASLAVDEQYLKQALREGSPNLAQRKAGHVDDYVARTATKVMRDAKVLDARVHLAAGAGALQMET